MTPGSERERVLVVDDERQVLVALEDLLSDEFTVLTADSAEGALRVVEQSSEIAVVITDQRMPKMAGDELLARLEGCTNATRMLLTGYADIAAVMRAVNEGRIFAYVSKPWDGSDLRQKVQRAAQHFRLAQDLASERRLLDDLMENIPDGIYFKDHELRFLRVNRPYAALLESTPALLVGKSMREVVGDFPIVETVEREEKELVAGSTALVDVLRPYRGGDGERWFSESKAPVKSREGEIVGLVGVTRDVTERKEHEARIARLTRIRELISGINATIVRARDREFLLKECCRIAAVAGNLSLAVISVIDPWTQSVRNVATEPDGAPIVRELEAIIAGGPHKSPLLAKLFQDPRPIVINDIGAAHFLRYQPLMLSYGLGSAVVIPLMRGKEIDAVFCLFSRQRNFFDDDHMSLFTEVADNISFALDHIAQNERLKFLAYHDSLTGLSNRDQFLERVDQRIQTNRPSGVTGVVLVADIGRFRHINETWGRRIGDALLVQLSARLKRLDSRVEMCARLFGNTFALLVPFISGDEATRDFLERDILPLFGRAFEVEGTEILAAARVGVARLPADGANGETLLANAEAALEKAKASGQPFVFYEARMNARIAEQMIIEAKLRRALERQEFLLHYQPKVDLKTGTVRGLEALIRWRDGSGSLVPPGSFIPLLEETGLIRDVGRWVMEHAAAQYQEWTAAGLNPPRIAVNVSALQLSSPDFIADLEHVLGRYPGTAPGIDLEITESVFVDDLDGSIAKLQAARRYGLKVSMDDFGMGYSSLNVIGRLPLDCIKIDRSFVIRMADDPQSTSIVTTIISLAHALDLAVVAEGVETAEQATLLRLLQCDQIQGYLVARPAGAESVVKMFGGRVEFMGGAA